MNTEVLGTVFANEFNCWDSGHGIAVAHVNVDDHVFLRMHENGRSVIQSGPRGRTSFSGWKLQLHNKLNNLLKCEVVYMLL